MFVDHGVSPFEVSLLLAVWSGTALVLEIPTGVLADHLPRPLLLAASSLLQGIGYVVWLVFPGFWGFLAGFVLWGASSALHSGTFEALIYDELAAFSHEEDYAQVIGRAEAASLAAVFVSGLAAAALAGFGYVPILAASIAACLAATLAALSFPRAPAVEAAAEPDCFAHLADGLRQVVHNPALAALIGFIVFATAFEGALDEFWPVFERELGLSNMWIAVVASAACITDAIASAIAHRFRGWSPRAFYLLNAATGLVLVATAVIFVPAAVVLLLVFNALWRIVDINFDARLQDAIETRTRATVSSMKGFAVETAATGLYLVVGAIAVGASWRAGFLLCGALIVVVSLAYALAAIRAKRRP